MPRWQSVHGEKSYQNEFRRDNTYLPARKSRLRRRRLLFVLVPSRTMIYYFRQLNQ